jgi:hypothetical protein
MAHGGVRKMLFIAVKPSDPKSIGVAKVGTAKTTTAKIPVTDLMSLIFY